MRRIPPGVDPGVVRRPDRDLAVRAGKTPHLLHDRQWVLKVLQDVVQVDLVGAVFGEGIWSIVQIMREAPRSCQNAPDHVRTETRVNYLSLAAPSRLSDHP